MEHPELCRVKSSDRHNNLYRLGEVKEVVALECAFFAKASGYGGYQCRLSDGILADQDARLRREVDSEFVEASKVLNRYASDSHICTCAVALCVRSSTPLLGTSAVGIADVRLSLHGTGGGALRPHPI